MLQKVNNNLKLCQHVAKFVQLFGILSVTFQMDAKMELSNFLHFL